MCVCVGVRYFVAPVFTWQEKEEMTFQPGYIFFLYLCAMHVSCMWFKQQDMKAYM